MDEIRMVTRPGAELAAAVSGHGPAVVLVHGWPHTRAVWSRAIPELARHHQVLAPDLRGTGESSRTTSGYDLPTLADDLLAVADLADAGAPVDVVALDAGVPPAFALALRRPDRVRRLVLIESLVGRLPGAEAFLSAGAPWWFGFHSVPGLAEVVLEGHEADYLDWFYRSGTLGRGIPTEVRAAFVAAYRGTESLRCGFEYYRAMPDHARVIAELVATTRLTVPTMAIGAHPVGAALAGQLRGVADDLVEHLLDDCGHIVPLDRPRELLDLIGPFLSS